MIHTDGTPTIAHRTEPMGAKSKPRRHWRQDLVYLVFSGSDVVMRAYDNEADALEFASYARHEMGTWATVHETTLHTREEHHTD